MADLYSVLPGIVVTQDDVLQAELLAQQYLQVLYPDLDLREGTALRDLVIRPTASLMALMNKGVTYAFQNNTIAGVTDDTPTDILDGLMSNWFLTRKLGTKAIIKARLYFAKKKSVTVSSGTFFSPDNTLKYFPDMSYVFSPSQLEFDAFNQEYYVDINLISENAGEAYNIETGNLLYFNNFDPFFLKAEISYLIQASSSPETNSEFITRSRTAISTRNLINNPSIESQLRENFNFITKLTSVGYGEEEMLRDRVRGFLNESDLMESTILHLGGKVDIYTKLPFSVDYIQFLTDEKGSIPLTGPYYEISHTEVQAGPDPDTMDAGVPFVVNNVNTGLDGDVGFSTRQAVSIDFGEPFANKTVSLELKSFKYMEGIQEFLDDLNNRVLAADLLVRMYNMYALSFNVRSHTDIAPSQEDVESAIYEYLESLDPGQAFVMSDLITYLNKHNVSNIVLPIEVKFRRFGVDLSLLTGTITDQLIPDIRTSIFVAEEIVTNSLTGN